MNDEETEQLTMQRNSMYQITGKYTTATLTIDNAEATCVAQINQFVNHPAFTNPVVIMPDTHAGKGCVIGFTMPMTPKVIPNVIGVDIGCGMLAINVGPTLNKSYEQLDKQIREAVPFGKNTHLRAVINLRKEFPWQTLRKAALTFAGAYSRRFGVDIRTEQYEGEDAWFLKKCDQINASSCRVLNSIGTLGGGNHFIEVGVDTHGDYWVTIHTGSRNLGKCICEYWQNRTVNTADINKRMAFGSRVQLIKEQFTGKDIAHQIQQAREQFGIDAPTSPHLTYLEGPAAHQYLFDMLFAQMYAEINRKCIANEILRILNIPHPKDQIESVHNFIDFDDLIIRKGAIRSYVAERMVIPFNMRDGVLLCQGKSNPAWNCSAPHGAGRVLSRSAAKLLVNLEDFKNTMSGIYSTSVGVGTLDESPMAYKSMDMITEAITPTADIIDKIIPVLNMKDSAGQDD